jgi:hypothetical protein
MIRQVSVKKFNFSKIRAYLIIVDQPHDLQPKNLRPATPGNGAPRAKPPVECNEVVENLPLYVIKDD